MELWVFLLLIRKALPMWLPRIIPEFSSRLRRAVPQLMGPNEAFVLFNLVQLGPPHLDFLIGEVKLPSFL